MMEYFKVSYVQIVHMSVKYRWKTNYGAKIVCLAILNDAHEHGIWLK